MSIDPGDEIYDLYDDLPDDDLDKEDELEAAWSGCGSRRKGQCDVVGTEYCDWQCPFRHEVFSPRRRNA